MDSGSRRRGIAIARHEAIREVSRRIRYWNKIKLGKVFNRDHTTIMYAQGATKRGREYHERRGIDHCQQ